MRPRDYRIEPCLWCKKPHPISEMITIVHQHPPIYGGHKAFEPLCYPCAAMILGQERADERFRRKRDHRAIYHDPPEGP
jgi:hypothetical protein